jgi:hypothetical protein
MCEDKFKARNEISLLNLVCLYLYKITSCTYITGIIRNIAILWPTYNLRDKIFSHAAIRWTISLVVFNETKSRN